MSVVGDLSVGRFDRGDDTLVGVLNNSSPDVSAVTVFGPGSSLSQFHGDGICSGAYGAWSGSAGCPYGPTDYEGPETSFVTDPSLPDSAEVDFTGGLQPGGSAHFSLEGALSSAELTALQGHLGVGCAAAIGGAVRRPSLTVTIERNNASDTAAGSGWAPDTTVHVYLDTAAGAHYIATTTSDSAGDLAPTALADFHLFLPQGAARQADPGEPFPIFAMDSLCDAATVGSLTDTTPNGTQLSNGADRSTSNGGCATSNLGLATTSASAAPPQLPLRTDGRWIVDSSNTSPPTRVKLASVNWYGAEEADFVPGGLQCQSIQAIAGEIARAGFNSVRLPWSNAMFEQNPSTCTSTDLGINDTCIPPEVLAANPQLIGQSAMSILTAVVSALAQDHIMVILDDHGIDADFTPTNFDGIWWGGQYWDDIYGYEQQIQTRTQQWISDWAAMVDAFKNQPYVVAADLRNEPVGANNPTKYCATGSCIFPKWGASDTPGIDNWRAAAQDAGDAILAENPNLLIVVEGLANSGDLTGVHSHPVLLTIDHRLVYSPHSYQNYVQADNAGYISYDSLKSQLGSKWGFILTQGKPWTAPVWVGEFGTTSSDVSLASPGAECSLSAMVPSDDEWFSCFTKYLSQADIDWSWWALNGTMSDGGPFNPDRTFYRQETFGLLAPDWSENSSLSLTKDLQGLQGKTQGRQPTTPRLWCAAAFAWKERFAATVLCQELERLAMPIRHT